MNWIRQTSKNVLTGLLALLGSAVANAATGSLAHDGRCAATGGGSCYMTIRYAGTGSPIYCVWDVSASPKRRINCQGYSTSSSSLLVTENPTTLVLKAQTAYGADDDATFNGGQRLASMTVSAIGPRNKLVVRTNPTTLVKEFYDATRARTVVLRGANYVRMDPVPDPFAGDAISLWHSTFDPAFTNPSTGAYTPAYWDPVQAYSALNGMSYAGYNWVKILISDRAVGSATAPGTLNQAYINNLADFVRIAADRGLYVTPVLAVLPKRGGYYPATPAGFKSFNTIYMTSSFIDAKVKYARDFVSALTSRLNAIGVNPNTVLSYNIEGEHLFVPCAAPLSWTSGLVTAGNGLTYNMGSPADKDRLMKDMTSNFIKKVRDGIRSIPGQADALVGIGFFTQPAADEYPLDFGDGAICSPKVWPNSAIATSEADYVDVHVYPQRDTDFNSAGQVDFTAATSFTKRAMASAGLSPTVKIAVLGEYGAQRLTQPRIGMSLQDAAAVLAKVQSSWCGNSTSAFQGWAVWTWDTMNVPNEYHYTMTETSGALNGVVAPLERVDPCNPVSPW